MHALNKEQGKGIKEQLGEPQQSQLGTYSTVAVEWLLRQHGVGAAAVSGAEAAAAAVGSWRDFRFHGPETKAHSF